MIFICVNPSSIPCTNHLLKPSSCKSPSPSFFILILYNKRSDRIQVAPVRIAFVTLLTVRTVLLSTRDKRGRLRCFFFLLIIISFCFPFESLKSCFLSCFCLETVKEKTKSTRMSETKQEDDTIMSSVHSTVFKESENLAGKCLQIEGYDFNRGVDYQQLLKSMLTTGFQASNFGDAVKVVNQMVFFLFYTNPSLFLYCFDFLLIKFFPLWFLGTWVEARLEVGWWTYWWGLWWR